MPNNTRRTKPVRGNPHLSPIPVQSAARGAIATARRRCLKTSSPSPTRACGRPMSPPPSSWRSPSTRSFRPLATTLPSRIARRNPNPSRLSRLPRSRGRPSSMPAARHLHWPFAPIPARNGRGYLRLANSLCWSRESRVPRRNGRRAGNSRQAPKWRGANHDQTDFGRLPVVVRRDPRHASDRCRCRLPKICGRYCSLCDL